MIRLFLAAVSAAFLVTGCIVAENNLTGTVGEYQVKISLGGVIESAATRSVESGASTTTGTVKILNGRVFLLNGSTVIASEEFPNTVTTAGGGAKTWTLTATMATNTSVYVVANIPSGVTALNSPVGMTLTQIKDVVADISTQSDYTTVVLANSNYSAKALENVVSPNPENNFAPGTATASIELAPVVSRLELGSVKATGSVITGFKVSGVYLTGYNDKFKFGGTAGGSVVNVALDNLPASPGYGVDLDDFSANASKVAAPTASKVWAYNVAAGSLPKLIIELSDITIANGTVPAGKQYLRVSGYTGGLTSFAVGKVYSIDELTFDETNISFSIDPIVTAVQPTATYSIKEWVPVNTDADIEQNLNVEPSPMGYTEMPLGDRTLLWATSPLTAFQTFAKSNSDPAAYFQWGNDTPVYKTTTTDASLYANIDPSTLVWNPCPTGWRLPQIAELRQAFPNDIQKKWIGADGVWETTYLMTTLKNGTTLETISKITGQKAFEWHNDWCLKYESGSWVTVFGYTNLNHHMFLALGETVASAVESYGSYWGDSIFSPLDPRDWSSLSTRYAYPVRCVRNK